mgnify:CR=1 FL=1
MMCEHTLFNEENLEKVFKSIDTDGSGALCQKEIAGLLGDDSELAREILEDLKKERGEDPRLPDAGFALLRWLDGGISVGSEVLLPPQADATAVP